MKSNKKINVRSNDSDYYQSRDESENDEISAFQEDPPHQKKPMQHIAVIKRETPSREPKTAMSKAKNQVAASKVAKKEKIEKNASNTNQTPKHFT